VPVREVWVSTIDAAVRAAMPPVILVAHSLGCHAVVDWAMSHPEPFGRWRSLEGRLREGSAVGLERHVDRPAGKGDRRRLL
jgi:hypothetical protein